MPLDRPIPAFYCCYLLRSKARPQSVYVGSTPNPIRRIQQHNGITKGGAVRTSRATLRPWEMACIVTGFPSSIAALQFEWAWQNPHLTLHIPPSSRLQLSTQKKKSGRPKRPIHTVTSLISNLHLLLQVPSFSRWPLEVRFFSNSVHESWVKWCKKAKSPIRSDLAIILDFDVEDPASVEEGEGGVKTDLSPKSKKRKEIPHHTQLSNLPITHSPQKQHFLKTQEILSFEREGSCSICHQNLQHDAGIYTICPTHTCESVSHLTCLSRKFLKDEGREGGMVPIRGICAGCREEVRWVDVVKEVSLRMRGQREVEKLLKEKRVKKATWGKGCILSQSPVDDENDDDEDDDDGEGEEEKIELGHEMESIERESTDEEMWHEISDSDSDSDVSSIISTPSISKPSKPPPPVISKPGTKKKKEILKTIIEDSDLDETIIID